MICFKDMTFCSAKCANKTCNLNWELRDKSDYERWAKDFNAAPVAFCDFSKDCKDYECLKTNKT